MTRYTLDMPPFAGRTGKGVRVAVVDSGVADGHPHVGALAGAVVIGGEGTPDPTDRIGHGTAVAAAIREKAPDAEIISVKVFHERLATNAAVLARGIETAAEMGARVINLSLGTANKAHEAVLRGAVERAGERGAVVVSAREANGVVWLPGSLSLSSVIGVIASWEESERDVIDMQADENGPMTVVASAYPRPVPGVPVERNLAGLSFAVANAAGFVARVMDGFADASVHRALRRALAELP